VATLARPAPHLKGSAAVRGGALVAAAFAVAALSLLLPYALAFDPWAWAVWGREVGHLALDTTSGPSWKPFPVLFTAPLALFGSATPALWLIIARAGGLLALAGTFTLATRLGGRWAGAAAMAVMALSPWWLYNTALGNSEGLLAASVTWAIVAHLDGRRRATLALLTAASLMRPEVWPFLIAYGVWMRDDRRSVLLAGGLVVLLWFGPDVVGAGGALDASKTGRGIPSPGSAKLADFPALALLGDTATLITIPALLAALLGAALGDRTVRVLAAGAAGWVAIVALMTTAGYAGNPRYLVAAAAVAAALAGVGIVRAANEVRRLCCGFRNQTDSPAIRLTNAAPLGAIALVAAVLAVTAGDLRAQARELDSRAAASSAFAGVLARAGGKDALLRCARIRTSSRARSLVAWRLGLPLRDLDARPVRPAVVIRAKWFYGEGLQPPRRPGYRTLVTTPYWQFVASCGRAPQVERP
jgi:hypothetical protein